MNKSIARIISGILTIYFAGCTANSKITQMDERPIVPVVQVMEKEVAVKNEYIAEIQAVKNIEIRARVQGFLEKIYVDEGEEVKSGQALFKLNDSEYRSQLSYAEAHLKSAEAESRVAELEVSRVRQLVEKNVLSPLELEVARAKFEAVEARIGEAHSAKINAELQLSFTTIKAPFDGVINRIPFKIGSLIDEGTLLTTISDLNEIYAYFNISEDEYLEYYQANLLDDDHSNEIVELVMANNVLFPEKGLIETVEGEFEPGTGSIGFRASFKNPDKILRHGATGRLRISQIVNNALLVPQRASFEIQDKTYVYVMNNDSILEKRKFFPGVRYGKYYLIDSGLKKGELVVLEGIQNLTNNIGIIPKIVSDSSLNILSY